MSEGRKWRLHCFGKMADDGLCCKWVNSDTVMDSEKADINVPIQAEKNENIPADRHGSNIVDDPLRNKVFCLEWNWRHAVLHLHLQP